ncbi:N-acetylmuramoyl-L-alanine amidase [Bradyrhizobium sp. Tv2a-2]|uniref:N-acetylmuramoyl-L-alanine amidase family protein n=1 Tax=Bradyrhizobium sp. Tv2a-2 TaxID=113395 RepID=UPI0018DD2461|nr:N-acetylmuramoyl-L-alanine amidase [Bradyrhizobium sp. Tv2a-2]
MLAVVLAALSISCAPAGAIAAPDIAPSPDTGVDRNPSCRREDFRIAIDVGHTPDAPGALSARGRPEYEFNHQLAQEMNDTFRRAGFAKTLLILMRGEGKTQLRERSVLASSFKADLFLSIHHDDVQPIFYDEWTYNGRFHHFSDKYAGFSIFVSRRNRFADQSVQFATLLGAELKKRGMTFTAHHAEDIRGERRQILDHERGVYRYDQLMVLKNTEAPAVLLEAGVIVNRDEESVLSSPNRRKQISEAALAAAVRFCSEAQDAQPREKR